MWPFSRSLEELREEDLATLIGRLESPTLDFKGDMYKLPEETRDMLCDVVSMANGEGGVIVLGMYEDKQSRATKIAPLNKKAEPEVKRITDLCLAHISDRIAGLKANRVLVSGGEVIVIRVPRSYRRPHMVTLDNTTGFSIRHGRQNAPMTMAEIRAALRSTAEIEMKVMTFLEQRQAHWENRYPSSASLFLAGTPLVLEEGRVDIHDPRVRQLVADPPAHGHDGSVLRVGEEPRPTLRGVRSTTPALRSLELFRTGHVEFHLLGKERFADRKPSGVDVLRADLILTHIRDLMTLIHELRKGCDIADPFAITFVIRRCKRMWLTGRGEGGRWTEAEWKDGGDLRLEPMTFALDVECDQMAKEVADRMWNAFGFWRCPIFPEAAG